MEHFWSNGLWDLQEVARFLGQQWASLINLIYESEWSWLFLFPLFVSLCALCLDIVLSFAFSVKFRQVKFFNVLSPKSWSMLKGEMRNSNRVSLSDVRNSYRYTVARSFSLTPFAFRLRYKKAKAGDLIKSKDGLRSVYSGIKLSADGKTILYKYHTQYGTYYSTMNPYRWSNSNGSQRLNSVLHKSKKKGG